MPTYYSLGEDIIAPSNTINLTYRLHGSKKDITITGHSVLKSKSKTISYNMINDWMITYIPKKNAFLVIAQDDATIKSINFK